MNPRLVLRSPQDHVGRLAGEAVIHGCGGLARTLAALPGFHGLPIGSAQSPGGAHALLCGQIAQLPQPRSGSQDLVRRLARRAVSKHASGARSGARLPP
eukprot:6723269-Alexandrium_andersonii.AAC.1